MLEMSGKQADMIATAADNRLVGPCAVGNDFLELLWLRIRMAIACGLQWQIPRILLSAFRQQKLLRRGDIASC